MHVGHSIPQEKDLLDALEEKRTRVLSFGSELRVHLLNTLLEATAPTQEEYSRLLAEKIGLSGTSSLEGSRYSFSEEGSYSGASKYQFSEHVPLQSTKYQNRGEYSLASPR